jgi:hypothetical protein
LSDLVAVSLNNSRVLKRCISPGLSSGHFMAFQRTRKQVIWGVRRSDTSLKEHHWEKSRTVFFELVEGFGRFKRTDMNRKGARAVKGQPFIRTSFRQSTGAALRRSRTVQQCWLVHDKNRHLTVTHVKSHEHGSCPYGHSSYVCLEGDVAHSMTGQYQPPAFQNYESKSNASQQTKPIRPSISCPIASIRVIEWLHVLSSCRHSRNATPISHLL